jgi:hypothetical protein
MTKTLDSTAVYAYTTLISMIVCLPFAIGMEGGALQAGAAAAIQKVGACVPQAAPSWGCWHDGFGSTTSSCWSSLPWFTFWVMSFDIVVPGCCWQYCALGPMLWCLLPESALSFLAVTFVQVGESRFYTDLFMVGLLYHLYNQVRLGPRHQS